MDTAPRQEPPAPPPGREPSRLRVKLGDLELDVAGTQELCVLAAQAYFPFFARKADATPLTPGEPQRQPISFLDELLALAPKDEPKKKPPPKEDELPPQETEDDKRGTRLKEWYLKMNVPSSRRYRKRNHCLLFIYWLTIVEGMGWATRGGIDWCFEVIGAKAPSYIPETMVSLRKTPWVAKPEMKKGKEVRGKYKLTKTGEKFVEGWVRVK
jgi:hypothetical protein